MSRQITIKITKGLAQKAYRLKRKGLTDGAVATKIGISLTSYQKHKREIKKFFSQFDLVRKANTPYKTMGRPPLSRFKDVAKPEIITSLLIADYSKTEIANILGMSRRTLYDLADKYPDIAYALEYGKASTDVRIIKSLLHRATGYSHPDTHLSSYQGEVIKTNITKHYPPDTAALVTYLTNKLGWKREPDIKGHNNKGKILEALETMNSLDDIKES